MSRRATGLPDVSQEFIDWDNVLARGEAQLKKGENLDALKTINIALRLATALPNSGKTAGMARAALAWSFSSAAKTMVINKKHKEAVDAAKSALNQLRGAYYRLPRPLGRAATMSAIYQCLDAVGLGENESAKVALEGLKSDIRAGLKKNNQDYQARILEIAQDLITYHQKQGNIEKAGLFGQWLSNRVGGREGAAKQVEKMIYQLKLEIEHMPDTGAPRELSSTDIEDLEVAAMGALSSFKKKVKPEDWL